jgi:predicted ATPase
MVYAACGDRDKAKARTEELIALSNEHGFPHWLSLGTAIEGWVLSVDGRHSEAIAKILEALRMLQESGFHFWQTYELAVLGEVCLKAGQAEQGLNVLNEEIERIRQPGRRFYESELFRLRAELMLMQTPEDFSRAETDIRQALDIARRQNAKSHELRAVVSAYRLRAVMGAYRLAQRQGEDNEARMQLSDLYESFKEGHDTRDLIEARALLGSK